MRSLSLRSLALALLSTTALLVPLATASAQTIDEAGARELEAQVPAVLDYLFSSNPDVRYSFNGDITAVPEGDSYRVTIPTVSVNADGDVDVELPGFIAQVTPQENGWQQAEWDFPGSIVVTNPRNSGDRADITFTSEGNMMTFAPQYGMALQSDVSFTEVSVAIQENPTVMTVFSMEMEIDTQPNDAGPHSFDSRTNLDANAVAISVPQEDVSIEIGGIGMQGTTQRQRLDLFAILQDRIQGIDPESTAFGEAFLDVLREHGDEKWMGGANYSMSMNDLVFDIEDVSGSLGSMSVTLVAEDLDQPAAQLGLQMAMNDSASPDLPAQFSAIIPSTAELDISAVDAPLEPILNEVYVVLGEGSEPEFGLKGRRAGTGGAAGLENLDPMMVLGLLLNSDALLEINSLFIEAPIGYISADGTIDPDPNAAFQAIAEISMDIAGLPEMISFVQQMGGEAAQAAGLASAIAAMGRDGTDEDGMAIKEFDFQLTANGQMLLNGNDLSAMMSMFQ